MQIPVFLPILLASDINVYSMARAFHEAYNKRSLVIARSPAGPIDHSKILDLIVVENLDETDAFLETVEQVAKEHAGKTLLLIGCADHYVRLIVEDVYKRQLDTLRARRNWHWPDGRNGRHCSDAGCKDRGPTTYRRRQPRCDLAPKKTSIPSLRPESLPAERPVRPQ